MLKGRTDRFALEYEDLFRLLSLTGYDCKIFYLWIMSPNTCLMINSYIWERNRDRDTQGNRDEETEILTQYLAYTECPYKLTVLIITYSVSKFI